MARPPVETVFPLPKDHGVRELVELITGRETESDAAAWRLLTRVPISQEALRLFGWIGLSTLVALARRGDRKAAEALVNQAIGLPDAPYRDQVRAMDAAAATAALAEAYKELGMTDAQAWKKAQEEGAPALALGREP